MLEIWENIEESSLMDEDEERVKVNTGNGKEREELKELEIIRWEE